MNKIINFILLFLTLIGIIGGIGYGIYDGKGRPNYFKYGKVTEGSGV